MAKGDFVGDTVTVANGADLVIQPGAGEVYKVTVVSGAGDAGSDLDLYDGTLVTHPIGQMRWISSGQDNTMTPFNMAFFIDNTDYMRIHNSTGSSKVYGYRGIQVK